MLPIIMEFNAIKLNAAGWGDRVAGCARCAVSPRRAFIMCFAQSVHNILGLSTRVHAHRAVDRIHAHPHTHSSPQKGDGRRCGQAQSFDVCHAHSVCTSATNPTKNPSAPASWRWILFASSTHVWPPWSNILQRVHVLRILMTPPDRHAFFCCCFVVVVFLRQQNCLICVIANA